MSSFAHSAVPPDVFCSSTLHDAALVWHRFGLVPLPIVPNSKRPALKWDPWLDGLSERKVHDHWSKFPDHELAFIVGDDLIVFDGDTPQSVAALESIEKDFGVIPNLIHSTTHGVHHIFRRKPGTVGRSDSHCSKQHPERIDIKTGRAIAILPPSTGKRILSCDAHHASELTEVGQDFIDAVFAHNGRPLPRVAEIPQCIVVDEEFSSENLRYVQALLPYIDPDIGYDDWIRVGMAINHESGGSDEGNQLFDSWSAKGKKYKGPNETDKKWNSFDPDHPKPITINTLKHLVAANGYDWMEILTAADGGFEIVDGTDGGIA